MTCVGQVSVSCSLCEEDTRIEWKCLNCDMVMCDKCKEKIHVKFKFAKDHKVVSIHEVGLHAEEIDFSNLSCKYHTRQSSVMFCKSCDCLVCPLCISKTHNGHDLVAIVEGYEMKIEKLKMGQMNVRTNIDELQKRKAEIKDVDSNEHSKFENTMKKIKDQKILLKNEVDQHAEKFETELIKKWEDLHMYTEKGQTETNLMIGSLESKYLKVDDIIQSKDAKKVFVDGVRLVKSMEESVTSPCTKFDFVPKFLPGQITAYNIGSLEKVSTKGDKIKIINQFVTQIPHVFYMAMPADSEDALWIADQNKLQKVKIEEKCLKIVAQKDIKIYGMAITPSKDLLLVCNGSRLKQMSDQTGEVVKSKYEVKGLQEITAVHVDSEGKVTVGALSGVVVYPAVGRRVVSVMDRNGRLETTYEYDRQGNSIFSYVKNITRTKNGNIIVVDRLSEDNIGRLVILSETGDILNTFNGQPSNTDKISFKPGRVITTPSDNIVVSNQTNDTLFYLNSYGNFIRWFDMIRIGIFNIYSLCVSESGHTYIGCGPYKVSKDKAKIYEVNIL